MLDHLSYSSISTWLMCPRSWKFRYLDKVQAPTSPALVFGSAFHNVIGAYLAATPVNRVPLSEMWPTYWNQQLEEELEINWGKDTAESCFNDGIRILSAEGVREVIDDLSVIVDDQGLYIERFVELRVPDVPVPIIGYIDMISEDGTPVDFKTSSRAWNSDKAQSEIQPLFYLAALTQSSNISHDFRFRHIIFTKTKNPQAQVIESQRSLSECFWLLTMIRDVWQAIDAGHYPPNPTGWKCSERSCEYWHLCRGKV